MLNGKACAGTKKKRTKNKRSCLEGWRREEVGKKRAVELAKWFQLLLNMQFHESTIRVCVAEGFRKLEESWLL